MTTWPAKRRPMPGCRERKHAGQDVVKEETLGFPEKAQGPSTRKSCFPIPKENFLLRVPRHHIYGKTWRSAIDKELQAIRQDESMVSTRGTSGTCYRSSCS